MIQFSFPLRLREYLTSIATASKKDPTNIDILIMKASIYENLKQTKKKMEVYENILKVEETGS